MLQSTAPRPYREGSEWMAKCCGLIAAIACGWVMGELQLFCLVAIAAFVVVQGLIPFFRVTQRLAIDQGRCQFEVQELKTSGLELAERLPGLDRAEMGTVFRLAIAVQQSTGRTSKEEAATRFLDNDAESWQHAVSPLDNSSEQAPLLGLGGSLLGILQSLNQLGDLEGGLGALGEAMSTMVSTTLVGCGCALLLMGLAAIANNAVARHLTYLRRIAGLMGPGGEENDRNQPDNSLF